jgi:fumarate reductase subunit C
MLKKDIIESLLGKDKNKKKSKIPAKLDFWQSATGLILAIFIMFHLIFESSILLGSDAMYSLTKFFEADFIFEGGEPLVISGLAFIIFTIFIIHSFLAMRKIPSKYKDYLRLKTHIRLIKHNDTTLWLVQVISGFIMFFLGSVHLYIMMTQPQKIGPFLSSDRIYSDVMWPLYLLLLVSVIMHAFIGIYRLIVKWGWFDREISKKVIQTMIILYTIIGLLSLFTYMKIGYDHKDSYGIKYEVKK